MVYLLTSRVAAPSLGFDAMFLDGDDYARVRDLIALVSAPYLRTANDSASDHGHDHGHEHTHVHGHRVTSASAS